MATLQKFKLLATQCAVSGSPSRSPTTSPVIHLRRRKTLRMLLGLAGSGGRKIPPRYDSVSPDRRRSFDGEMLQQRDKELSVGHKLRDLFVSSPPALGEGVSESGRGITLPLGGRLSGEDLRRGGGRSPRPLTATLRQRLLRRAWRPVLVGIPE